MKSAVPTPKTRHSPTDGSEGDYLNVREAGELSRLSEVSIRRYLTKGKLKRYKIFGRTLVKKSELLGLIREV